jgi:hypothetical protein
MADALPPLPWEQQPGESSRAFGAFRVYRDLGPHRSLRAAAAAFYGRAATSLERQVDKWSHAFRWVERATAWDGHLDAEARQAQEKARRDMAERHAQEARGLQAKALERLRALRPEELGPADVLRYFVEAAKLERLALGEPETVAEQRYGPVVLHIIEEVVGRQVLALTDNPGNPVEENATHDSNISSSTVIPNNPIARDSASLRT